MPQHMSLRIAVVGAGPVGLALALHARARLPHAQLTLFDARPADRDVAADPRTLALALGSVQWLQRWTCWPAAPARADPRRARVAGAAVCCRRRRRGAADAPPSRACRCSARCSPTARWWRRCSRPGRPPCRPSRRAASSPLRHAGARRSSRWPTASRSTPASPRRFDLGGRRRRRRVRRPGAQGAGARLRADRLGRHRHAGRRHAGHGLRALHAPRAGGAAAAAAGGRRRRARGAGLVRRPAPTTRCADLDDAQRLAVLNTLLPGRGRAPGGDVAAEAPSRSA